MKGETPERQWERLQREYQKAVEASYPNQERRGCPGTEVLRDLAARSSRHEDIEGDERWKHTIHCGPCYQEYLDLRALCRGAKAKRDREIRAVNRRDHPTSCNFSFRARHCED